MLFRSFIWIISLSPLFFGANRPWSWSLYSLLIACIGLAYFGNSLINKTEFTIAIKPLKYPLCLACIPILWALVQISSWVPAGWVHPFWLLAGAQLPQTITPTISLYPQETVTALMKLMSYFLVFFLSFQFNRQSTQANITFNATAYTGLAYAIYGLIAFWGNYNTLFSFENSTHQDSVRSTFINRNSYATYAGLTLLATLSMLLVGVKGSLVYGLKNNFGIQYFLENLLSRAWLPILIIITISTALLLSHSRGGFLSTFLAILVFFIILSLTGKLKKGRFMIILLLITTITGFSFWNSSDMLIGRLDKITLDDKNDRLNVYSTLNTAISENFWLGTGYGSFKQSYRLYRNETVRGYFDKAHNTYLENMFELGVFHAFALFSAILIVALYCLHGVWIRQRNWHYPAIGFATTILVGLHSLVDFSLQMPAVAYTYALLMGASFAQSLPRNQRCRSSSR